MGTLQAVEDPDPSRVIFMFQAPPPLAPAPQVRLGNKLERDTPFFFFFFDIHGPGIEPAGNSASIR